MNDNEPYVLSKNTLTYRLFYFLSTFFLTSWLIRKDKFTHELACFENLCMFIRTIFFLVIYVFVLLFCLYSFFVSVSALYQLDFNNYFFAFTITFVFTFFIALICLTISSIVEIRFQKKLHKEDNQKRTTNILVQSLKDKHAKICRQIKIKDN